MSLHSGLDTMAIATIGIYTGNYNSVTGAGAVANLYASLGLLEDAPDTTGLYARIVGMIGRRMKIMLGG